VAQARLVIANGAGYEKFMCQLLGATVNAGRVALSVQEVPDAYGPDVNPHFWYDVPRLPGYLQLHKDTVTGEVDAAVIDKQNGKPHVAKRLDRPRVRVIPEWFGGGTLPRKELHEMAEQLTASQAGLIAVGEPTIEKTLDKALTKADKVVKRNVDATTDEITSELQEALKS